MPAQVGGRAQPSRLHEAFHAAFGKSSEALGRGFALRVLEYLPFMSIIPTKVRSPERTTNYSIVTTSRLCHPQFVPSSHVIHTYTLHTLFKANTTLEFQCQHTFLDLAPCSTQGTTGHALKRAQEPQTVTSDCEVWVEWRDFIGVVYKLLGSKFLFPLPQPEFKKIP